MGTLINDYDLKQRESNLKQGIKLNYNMYSSKFVTKRNLGF